MVTPELPVLYAVVHGLYGVVTSRPVENPVGIGRRLTLLVAVLLVVGALSPVRRRERDLLFMETRQKPVVSLQFQHLVIFQNVIEFVVIGHLHSLLEGLLHPEVEISHEEDVVIETDALEHGVASPERPGEFLITLNTLFDPGGLGVQMAIQKEETGVEESERDTDPALIGDDVCDSGGFGVSFPVGDIGEERSADENQQTHL